MDMSEYSKPKDYSPLIKAQKYCQEHPVFKKSQAHNYKFADLGMINSVVGPALSDNELMIVDNWYDYDYFRTTIYDKGGELISVSVRTKNIDMDKILRGSTNHAQAQGALETYLRRYNRIKLFNLHAIEDDDAASLDYSQPRITKSQNQSRPIDSGLEIPKDSYKDLKQLVDKCQSLGIEIPMKQIQEKYGIDHILKATAKMRPNFCEKLRGMINDVSN